MRNTIGNNITLTLFGESHNEAIGAVIDGLKAGIKVDDEFIKSQLSKRRPRGKGETSRVENDNYKIISGVFNGYTTGAPICVLIENTNTKSSDYEKIKDLPRPSHADYVASIKYNNYTDYRGGGHFSGRITAPIVACGAIIIPYLESMGIKIGTHIKEISNIKDIDLVDEAYHKEKFDEILDKINNKDFPVYNDIEEKMQEKIEMVQKNGDSIGGVVQTCITGLPVGVGEPWFSSLESEISKAIFGIGAVKGIEFGRGFDFKNYTGKAVNDEFSINDGQILTNTNNNGGINGGISNGMPVVFNTAIKPTPSISIAQNTVNLKTMQNEWFEIMGRHDPAIIRRVCIVLTSITAIVIADMMSLYKANL